MFQVPWPSAGTLSPDGSSTRFMRTEYCRRRTIAPSLLPTLSDDAPSPRRSPARPRGRLARQHARHDPDRRRPHRRRPAADHAGAAAGARAGAATTRSPWSKAAGPRSPRSCTAATTGCIVVVGPCSIHDHDQAIEYGQRLKAVADELRGRALRRHARLFREAAHDRRLEGLHQRPAPRRQLRHQRRARARAPAAARADDARRADRHRVPRPAQPAVHRRARSPGARSARARPRARAIASSPPG